MCRQIAAVALPKDRGRRALLELDAPDAGAEAVIEIANRVLETRLILPLEHGDAKQRISQR
jgi:hypothetical protein